MSADQPRPYRQAGNLRSLTGQGYGYTAYTCLTCGSLVHADDRSLHDAWHATSQNDQEQAR